MQESEGKGLEEVGTGAGLDRGGVSVRTHATGFKGRFKVCHVSEECDFGVTV